MRYRGPIDLSQSSGDVDRDDDRHDTRMLVGQNGTCGWSKRARGVATCWGGQMICRSSLISGWYPKARGEVADSFTNASPKQQCNQGGRKRARSRLDFQDQRRMLHWFRSLLRVLSGPSVNPRSSPTSSAVPHPRCLASARLCSSEPGFSTGSRQLEETEWLAPRGRVVNEAICFRTRSHPTMGTSGSGSGGAISNCLCQLRCPAH
jgi:hypothetical protein